jgi:Glu-tRNA(Gln) amidotransferase subunit E-like FAD-binding protein
MMLKECCQNLTENNVENLLNIMTELKIYNFFVNDLLHSIVFEFLMSKEDNMNIDDRVWKKTIRSLTLESIRNIVRDIGTKESLTNVENRTLYNILIT